MRTTNTIKYMSTRNEKPTWINFLKYVGLLFFFLTFALSLTAQSVSISGTVTDRDMLPLPGVTVLKMGTNYGTATSYDGHFTLNDIVKGGDERIKLKDNGLNKYHGNPLIYESVFNRGSCTMSNLNLDSKRAVDKMLNRLKKDNYDKNLPVNLTLTE